MEEREDKPCLYITYKDGYAEVEIEEDGVRRKHDAKYKNTDGKDEYDFCAEVADKVEAEMGVPALWSFVNGKKKQQKKPSTPLVIMASIAAFAVVFGVIAVATNAWSSHINTIKEESAAQAKAELDRQKQEMMNDLKEELKAVQPTEVYLESNSSYAVCTGTVTNKSDKVHSFIKVKGEFMDEGGNTIDTAWTYACGDEGLAPGESSKFTMSVSRDSRITNVRCYTYDFV